jgi:hypothetical protein
VFQVLKGHRVLKVFLAKMVMMVDLAHRVILVMWVTGASKETGGPMEQTVTMVWMALRERRAIKDLKDLPVYQLLLHRSACKEPVTINIWKEIL